MTFLLRPFYVFLKLLPYAISFLRDWQRYILFGSPRVLEEEEHRRRAGRITHTLAALGPAFIKGAQVLSTREDLIPKTYTDELKKLQDRVPPFPVKEALRLIEEETGRPASQVFEHFEHEPLAAASLGQVHRATYKGQQVAVKILRPGVRDLVEMDLQVVSMLIRFVHFFVDHHLVRSFWAIHLEYTRMIRQEMDFFNEEANADRLRRMFAGDDRVLIPQCHSELTTSRLVVFDFIEGGRIDDPRALASSRITPQELVARLIEIYVRMAVIHGFIHADPHPGNLLVDPEGRIVILDYGMALDFPEEVRLQMLRGCMAVVRQDLDTLVDAFYSLKMVEPDINRALVRDAAATLLKIQLRKDFHPRLVQEIADDILDTFHKFPLRMPQQLVYLFRASALVEGIGFRYDPHFSGVREATPIIKRLMREVPLEKKLDPRVLVEDFGRQIVRTTRHLVWIVERLEREELHVRLHQGDMRNLETMLTGLLRRWLLGAGAVGWAVIGFILFHMTNSWILLLSLLVPSFVIFLLCLAPPLRRRPRL